MQITQNNNSPQFSGSFLINYRKALPEMRKAFESVIGEHKVQVFDNFNGKENHVMYVMKDSKDYDAANFIIKNEVNFRYYPEVSTKMQFSPSFPEEVTAYFKNNRPKILQKHCDLKEYIEKYRANCRQKKDSHLSLLDKILTSLKIDRTAGQKIKDSRAITTFVDNASGNKVVMSPKNAMGTYFVMVNPKNDYDPIKRYAFDDKGNLLKTFEPPNGIKLFNDKFKDAIAYQSLAKK